MSNCPVASGEFCFVVVIYLFKYYRTLTSSIVWSIKETDNGFPVFLNSHQKRVKCRQGLTAYLSLNREIESKPVFPSLCVLNFYLLLHLCRQNFFHGLHKTSFSNLWKLEAWQNVTDNCIMIIASLIIKWHNWPYCDLDGPDAILTFLTSGIFFTESVA